MEVGACRGDSRRKLDEAAREPAAALSGCALPAPARWTCSEFRHRKGVTWAEVAAVSWSCWRSVMRSPRYFLLPNRPKQKEGERAESESEVTAAAAAVGQRSSCRDWFAEAAAAASAERSHPGAALPATAQRRES